MKNARVNNPRSKCLGLYYEPIESPIATRFEILGGLRCDVLVSGYGRGLFAGRPTLLYRRLTIALLQRSDGDGQDELLFTVIVEFDHDILFGAGKHRT